jgi:hypothetical protein
VRSQERLLAEPVLPLLRAWGGVLDAHLGDGHLGHVDKGVHPDFAGDRKTAIELFVAGIRGCEGYLQRFMADDESKVI